MTMSRDSLSRRDFLKAGAVGAGSIGLTLSGADLLTAGATHGKAKNCIVLFLVGGPSQLETFDPKPNAPENVRGPFGTIRTNVPGIHLSETLPGLAKIADKFAIVRTVHHTSAPIHETGQQLMQTGRLAKNGVESPNIGAVLSYLLGPRTPKRNPWTILPWRIENTGVSVGHGQSPGHLGDRYAAHDVGVGPTGDFGRSCLAARTRISLGFTRFATVNMFDTVFNKVTWDCHTDGGSLGSTFADYRLILCPMFETAYCELLLGLEERGLLDTTLVVAMGEFGRTPQINPRGGRDHWPGCWSVLFGGGGIRGGQVIGTSDAWAAEPKDRPVTPAEIAATIYAAHGLDPRRTIPGPDGSPVPLADAAPIRELFG